MSSSAARRGVDQRVLILSRLGRVSRVLGVTQHPALPTRAVGPASGFGPWLPRVLRTRPRRPRPIGSARPRSQGVGGVGGADTRREDDA